MASRGDSRNDEGATSSLDMQYSMTDGRDNRNDEEANSYHNSAWESNMEDVWNFNSSKNPDLELNRGDSLNDQEANSSQNPDLAGNNQDAISNRNAPSQAFIAKHSYLQETLNKPLQFEKLDLPSEVYTREDKTPKGHFEMLPWGYDFSKMSTKSIYAVTLNFQFKVQDTDQRCHSIDGGANGSGGYVEILDKFPSQEFKMES